MSRKKVNKPINTKKSQIAVEKEKFKLWLFSLSFQLLTLGLGYLVYRNILVKNKLPGLYLFLWWFLFITRASVTSISHKYWVSNNQNGLMQFKNVLKIKNIISVLLLACLMFPVVYYSPFPGILSSYFQSTLLFSRNLAVSISNLITLVISAVSGSVGNITLSVLGNLLYDIGKSIYGRFKKPNNEIKNKKTKKLISKGL